MAASVAMREWFERGLGHFHPVYGEVHAGKVNGNSALICDSASTNEPPYVVGVMEPTRESVKYAKAWCQLTVAAFTGSVGHIRMWPKVAPGLVTDSPLITIGPNVIRWQYWSAEGGATSLVKTLATTIAVGDVVRVELIGPELRVQTNGVLTGTCIDERYDVAPGWMGCGFSHDSVGSALRLWAQGPLGEFTR